MLLAPCYTQTHTHTHTHTQTHTLTHTHKHTHSMGYLWVSFQLFWGRCGEVTEVRLALSDWLLWDFPPVASC